MSTDDNKLVRIEMGFEQGGLVIKPAEGETIRYSPEDTQVIYNHLDQQQAWLARSSFVLIPVPGGDEPLSMQLSGEAAVLLLALLRKHMQPRG